jgi:hypothetical protein
LASIRSVEHITFNARVDWPLVAILLPGRFHEAGEVIHRFSFNEPMGSGAITIAPTQVILAREMKVSSSGKPLILRVDRAKANFP